MRSLITGATGFIGQRLVRCLLRTHGAASIFCLVMAPAARAEAEILEEYRAAGIQVIQGDLMNQPVSGGAPPAVDAVFHLAANISTDAGERDLRVNHVGTSNLLEWLQPVSTHVRLIQASTVAVHDRNAQPLGPLDETSPLVPRTWYGKSKLQAETILRDRAAHDGFHWTIVRLPTVYGPGQKAGGLLDQLTSLTSSGAVLGRIDWPGRTSIIHVDDAVDIMIDLAGRPEAAGEVFGVASDESLTVGEMARTIGRATGHDVRAIAIPAPLLRAGRAAVWNPRVAAAMPRFASRAFWQLSLILSDGFWLDTAKLRRVYTKPLRTLEHGLADTLHTRQEAAPQPERVRVSA